MGWWDDLKSLWNSGMPIFPVSPAPFIPQGASLKDAAIATGVVGALGALAGGGTAIAGAFGAAAARKAAGAGAGAGAPIAVDAARAHVGAPMYRAPASGYRSRSPRRTSTVQSIARGLALSEGRRALTAYHRKRKAKPAPRRKSARIAKRTVVEEQYDQGGEEPAAPRKRRRSSKPPTRKQLAARRRFAARARRGEFRRSS